MEEKGKIIGDLNWDGLQKPRLYFAVLATFFGLFLAVLDGTICNVALPAMAEKLDISSSESIWIVNAFQLVIMMTLLPFASLGELIGYKKVYTMGVAVFTVGSLLCSLSGTLAELVGARVFQGIGASMIMSINTSLIKIIYPKRHLGKGVGLNATVVALASVAGPTLAAAILAVADWPWLFAVNVPVGIATLILAWMFLPDNPTIVAGRKFNWKDAVLNALTFGLFIGSVEAYSHGMEGKNLAMMLMMFVLTGYIYVKSQIGKEYAMLPFDLLSIPVFSLSVATSILSFTAQMLCMVAMPFMLVQTFGYSAVETGLVMTAWPLIIIFVAPLAGLLIGRVHPGILGAAGLLLMSTGCFSMAYIPSDASYAGIVARLMLCGAGFGMFQSPNNHMLLSSAPSHRSGSAGGMLATARLTGQTIGAALVALLFNFIGSSAPHDAMLVAGIMTVLGAVTSYSRTMKRN